MSQKVDRSVTEVVRALGRWGEGTGPLYQRLAAAVQYALDAGSLAPGTRMPSERRLADLLAISRTTVVAAYAELRTAGVIQSRRGSGSRINPELRRPPADGGVPDSKARTMFQRMIDGPSGTTSSRRRTPQT